jgi:hypothetical protein
MWMQAIRALLLGSSNNDSGADGSDSGESKAPAGAAPSSKVALVPAEDERDWGPCFTLLNGDGGSSGSNQ